MVESGDREILVSTQQLCQYLDDTEDTVRKREERIINSFPPGAKKRKRPETPPEKITSDDEEKYTDQEERAAKHIDKDDPDYDYTSIGSGSSKVITEASMCSTQ